MERYPQTYRGLARTIGIDIFRYCEAAGQQPDDALLARVARALGHGDAVEEDSAIEALEATVDAILEAAEKTGALDVGFGWGLRDASRLDRNEVLDAFGELEPLYRVLRGVE